MRWATFVLGLGCVGLVAGCRKVPIEDIFARFDRADAAWFQDEETLFFFYELSAEQGISEDSLVEIRYRTDDTVFPWTALETLNTVHQHVPVDCGFKRICGSFSLHERLQPRDVGIRMRYHRAGEVFLDTSVDYNVIGTGPAHTNRSLIVYGVFTEDNRRIQWRARHQFPTLRNEQAEALGLRRRFQIDTQQYGSALFSLEGNPYGYGSGCPGFYEPTTLTSVNTVDRAVFNMEDLPLEASISDSVCALATVHEPRAPFITTAIARKNPEVAPAFPVLRSPLNEATPLKFYFLECSRVISADHDAMQRQRILFGNGEPFCIDAWRSSEFVDRLINSFRDAIESERPAGKDMILVIGLHRDAAEIANRVEAALAVVVPPERDRSTPRLVGAFVFDSAVRDVMDEPLSRLVLWCPARVLNEETPLPDPSRANCALVPELPNLRLGPLAFSQIPILPSRDRYLRFIDQYSDGQAGEVRALRFLAPEFTPTTDNIDLGGAVGTFLNGEIISAEEDDAFSFCETAELQTFIFRSPTTIAGRPAGFEFLPISSLPAWHNQARESQYELGLLWDFPWLLQMTYEVVVAAQASAFGVSVPFGIGAETTDDLGTQIWRKEEFPLAELLTQCRRFCENPTFDSAGIYNVLDLFRITYEAGCYRPKFPVLGDSSFPRDP